MDPISKYFELEGASIRFMQEIDLDNGSEKDIASLLINAPGENAIKGKY